MKSRSFTNPLSKSYAGFFFSSKDGLNQNLLRGWELNPLPTGYEPVEQPLLLPAQLVYYASALLAIVFDRVENV